MLKAENLFQLIKVDREYNTTGRLDDRKMARIKEYGKAVMSLNDYKECEEIESLDGRKDYPKVKKAILEGVPGTGLECYDEDFNPIEKLER